MRERLACTALLAPVGAPAQAAVVYDFVTTPKSPLPEERIGPDGSLPLRITVGDAVYLRGSVSLRREGCHGVRPWECDKTSCWNHVAIESTSPLWGSGTVALALLPGGTLSGGIVEDGADMSLALAGSDFEWAGSRFGSDVVVECGIGAAPARGCAFTGDFFTGPFPAPEPMGAALLDTDVLGLTLARRRAPG